MTFVLIKKSVEIPTHNTLKKQKIRIQRFIATGKENCVSDSDLGAGPTRTLICSLVDPVLGQFRNA